MKYVYVSPALPENVFSGLLGYGKGSPGQQAQKYNKLLARGISLCGRALLMLSAPPVPPGSKLFKLIRIDQTTDSGIDYKFLSVLDIPVIKNVYTYFQAKKEIKRIVKESSEEVCVVCDLLTLSASLGALKAAKSLGIRSCGIVTDLPGYLAGKPSSKRYAKMYGKAVALCGSFVLLTKHMAKALPVGDRPFVVIEGISTPVSGADSLINAPASETSSSSGEVFSGNKYIFYAGGIEKAYGVEKLVKAFIEAAVPSCELVLCGSGSYAGELEKIAAENSLIRYLGVVPNEKAMELEKNAALLINPRTSEGEFTAYSFPSKNIEYMSTGTPVLAYMLPGIPEEYREFFITPADESVEALTQKIRETLALSCEELRMKGKKAAEFARDKKSPASQAALLTDMVENEGDKK